MIEDIHQDSAEDNAQETSTSESAPVSASEPSSEQKREIARWVADGMGLSDLQKKIDAWHIKNKLNINVIKKFLTYRRLASKKKCKYIICDIKYKRYVKQKQIKFFFYKKQIDLFEIAKIFYSLDKLKIVFVTGTNGKTSIAYGANKLFNLNGNKSCYIGTLGFYINSKKIKKLKNTTPSYFEILNLLQIASNNRVKFVFIEVSSIGYSEGRIGNLKYNYCILTNLKSDHLDYHKNLKSYHTAKVNLIKNHRLKNSILFIQDDYLKHKFNKRLILPLVVCNVLLLRLV